LYIVEATQNGITDSEKLKILMFLGSSDKEEVSYTKRRAKYKDKNKNKDKRQR
jgi:hypothetical protein